MTHREKKAAKTKLALLDSALRLMSQKSFDEVAIAEICQQAEVSYATFFNYFESKDYLLIYFVQLWSVEASHRAIQAGGGLKGIVELFEFTAKGCQKLPEVMEEIISFQAKGRNLSKLNISPLSEAEKILRFPHIHDFSGLPDAGLGSILPPLIRQAMEFGEMKPEADVNEILLALTGLFLGLPVALASNRMKGLAEAYRRQLSILWGGFNAQPANHLSGGSANE